MSNNLIIKNVRIVDADKDIHGDLLVAGGKIFGIIERTPNSAGAVGFIGDYQDCLEIDGQGKVLMPSFIDLHAHFREPGYTYKEDIESGSKAAVKGGYTTVVLMANTNPVCSNMEIVNYVKKRAEEVGLIYVEQVVSITEDLNGYNIDHLTELDDSIKFVSDDGKGVMDNRLMEEVLKLSKEKDFIVISHAEDHSFSSVDMRKAENYMTLRDVYACKETGGRLHMAHVSTKEALEMIIDGKKNGANVTCEVTPHHIFSDNSVSYRVNPPLRESEDVDFLIKSIKDGYVDIIATDHAPHTHEDKQNGSPGISGIEVSFTMCFTKLVKEGHIGLSKLSEMMSKNPAKIMNIKRGLIQEGYDGDLVLIDIDKKSFIDVNKFVSKGKNSPFDEYEVYGEVLMTIKNGKIVYKSENQKRK